MKRRPVLAIFGMLITAWMWVAQVGSSPANDEKLLQDAKLGTDGTALLEFFRQRTLTDANRQRLEKTIRLLGDESFPVREQASKDLVEVGRSAIPLLKLALKDADPEIVRRAERCLEVVDAASQTMLTTAAVRLLEVRRPAGSVEVLLTYLPSACDHDIEEAVFTALAALAVRDGKPDRAIVAALSDKDPLRRLAAAVALGKAAPEHRKTVRALFDDPEPRVRFRAASVLVHAGDKSAVPHLIKVVSEGPQDFATEATDLLGQIGGESPSLPAIDLATDDSRRKSGEAWTAWWKDNEARVDLGKLKLDGATLGLTIICERDLTQNKGRVWACGRDGRQRWLIEDLQYPTDVRRLPGGRLLITDYTGGRVIECDQKGKVHWQHNVGDRPWNSQRLPNGNTFIVTTNQLLEVDRAGKVVVSHRVNGRVRCGHKLPNGHVVYLSTNYTLVELDDKGKEVRNTPLQGVRSLQLLPNGRYLVAQYTRSRVVEVDADGKEHWQCTAGRPMDAQRLPNGNTLVVSTTDNAVIEFDRQGKEVWRQKTLGGRPVCARRY